MGIGTTIQDFQVFQWILTQAKMDASTGTKSQVIPELSIDKSLLQTLYASGHVSVGTQRHTKYTTHIFFIH